jgi:hypothetical protein
MDNSFHTQQKEGRKAGKGGGLRAPPGIDPANLRILCLISWTVDSRDNKDATTSNWEVVRRQESARGGRGNGGGG